MLNVQSQVQTVLNGVTQGSVLPWQANPSQTQAGARTLKCQLTASGIGSSYCARAEQYCVVRGESIRALALLSHVLLLAVEGVGV